MLRMNQPNTGRIELGDAAVPNVTVDFDDGRDLANGLASGDFDGSDFNTHYMELRGDDIEDEITGGTVGGTFTIDKGGVKALQFGVSLTDRKKARDLVNNTLNGGADYYSGDFAINVGDLDGEVISHSFTLPHFMNDVSSEFPRTFLAFDVPNYLAALGGLRRQCAPGRRHLRFRECRGRSGIRSRVIASAKRPPASTCRRTLAASAGAPTPACAS